MARLIVNIIDINRMPVFIKKTAERHHTAIFRTLPFQTVKNTVITIGARRPTRFQRAITAYTMSSWLRFAKGQNDMQMVFPPIDITGRKPEIIALKMVEI